LKRKMLFLVLIALLAVVLYLYLRPPTPILSADQVYNVTEVGQTVPINFTMTNMPGVNGWNMRVTWDPNYLQPAAVEEGPFFQTAASKSFFGITSEDKEIGEMIVADVFLTRGDNVQGTGVILIVNFTTVQVGTSTIELHAPGENGTDVVIGDAQNLNLVGHIEVDGLISNEGSPPVWASTDFQSTIILGEIAVLTAVSGILYLRTHPRQLRVTKSKRVDLQPVLDPEDQRQSN